MPRRPCRRGGAGYRRGPPPRPAEESLPESEVGGPGGGTGFMPKSQASREGERRRSPPATRPLAPGPHCLTRHAPSVRGLDVPRRFARVDGRTGSSCGVETISSLSALGFKPSKGGLEGEGLAPVTSLRLCLSGTRLDVGGFRRYRRPFLYIAPPDLPSSLCGYSDYSSSPDSPNFRNLVWHLRPYLSLKPPRRSGPLLLDLTHRPKFILGSPSLL